MSDLNKSTNAQLFRQYSEILRELRRREIVRTNNAPAGDYAEWLVHRVRGGVLEPNSKKSHDIKDANGVLIQVKARVVSPKIGASQRQMSPFRSWDFDQAALIQFADDDYSVVRAVLVPVENVQSVAVQRSHVNGWIAHMTEALMTSDGTEDITGQVIRAANLKTVEPTAPATTGGVA